MDPYIETFGHWEDFHHNLITEIQGAISAVLPQRYVVRAGERSYVALAQLDDGEGEHFFLPDVIVPSRHGPAKSKRKTKGPGITVLGQGKTAPIMMRALVKTSHREPYLEIRQVDPEHKLVTGIEVLSPSNKRPGTKGWRLYNRKRLAYLSGYANLVEIDLLRGGRRMPMASPWPDSPYYLLVCRKKEAPRCAVWPATFQAPLPPIPVPLAPPDPDLSLALQPLAEAVYARSRYERDIDYRQPLRQPLDAGGAAWLEERLRQRQEPR
jgi:hypothetical protein